MLKIETGRIVKSLSGFYDVQTEKKVITCRARGSFTLEFVRYEEVPKANQDKIIKEAQNED